MSYPQDTIRRRVRRGVKLLDEFGPKNWRKRISLPQLDLTNGATCVIGQAIKMDGADFTDKFAKLAKKAGIQPEPGSWGPNYDNAHILYGFDAEGTTYTSTGEYYDRLTETWRRELQSV